MEQIMHALVYIYIAATCCGGAFFAFKLLRSTITTPEHTIL